MRLQPSGFGDVLSGLIFIALSGQVTWRELPLVRLAIVGSGLVSIACGIIFSAWLPYAALVAGKSYWRVDGGLMSAAPIASMFPG
jgi:hypothetical protein